LKSAENQPKQILSAKNDIKLGGRIYVRRLWHIAVGGADLAEFLLRLIFG